MQIEIFIVKACMQKEPEIKHFIIPQMQKHLTEGGVQTPKIYLWIETKKSLNFRIFSSTIANFS